MRKDLIADRQLSVGFVVTGRKDIRNGGDVDGEVSYFDSLKRQNLTEN